MRRRVFSAAASCLILFCGSAEAQTEVRVLQYSSGAPSGISPVSAQDDSTTVTLRVPASTLSASRGGALEIDGLSMSSSGGVLLTVDGNLLVTGNTTLGNENTDSTTVRGILNLSDNSATYPLQFPSIPVYEFTAISPVSEQAIFVEGGLSTLGGLGIGNDAFFAANVLADGDWFNEGSVRLSDGPNRTVNVNGTIQNNSIFGWFLTLEGATADNFETSLFVTDPTADRSITFPDATGDVLLDTTAFADPTASVDGTAVNGTATTALRSDAAPALANPLNPSGGVQGIAGAISTTGNDVLGDAESDSLTVNSGNIIIPNTDDLSHLITIGTASIYNSTTDTLRLTDTLIVEDILSVLNSATLGNSNGDEQLIRGELEIRDADGSPPIYIGQKTGTPGTVWNSNPNEITAGPNVLVPNDLTVNQDANISAASFDITLAGEIQGQDPFVLEGLTDNLLETTIRVTDPTADNIITLQDGTGTLAFTSEIPAAANPTATVDGTATNGVATTFMRSDAAPALNDPLTPSDSTQNVTGSVRASANVVADTAMGVGVASPSGLEVRSSVTGTALGADNIRFGISGGIPAIIMEDGSDNIVIDNNASTVRFLNSAAGFAMVDMNLPSSGQGYMSVGGNAAGDTNGLLVSATTDQNLEGFDSVRTGVQGTARTLYEDNGTLIGWDNSSGTMRLLSPLAGASVRLSVNSSSDLTVAGDGTFSGGNVNIGNDAVLSDGGTNTISTPDAFTSSSEISSTDSKWVQYSVVGDINGEWTFSDTAFSISTGVDARVAVFPVHVRAGDQITGIRVTYQGSDTGDGLNMTLYKRATGSSSTTTVNSTGNVTSTVLATETSTFAANTIAEGETAWVAIESVIAITAVTGYSFGIQFSKRAL